MCNASRHKTYSEAAPQQDATGAQQQFDAKRAREGDLARMLCEVMSLTAGEKHSVSPHHVLRAAVVAAPKPLIESSGALAIEIGRRLGMKAEAIYATLAEYSAR
jgi:hypothetical protein